MMNLIVTAGVLAGLILFLLWLRKRRKKPAARSPYQDALHLLLDGKQDEALEKLKKTVNADTDNIMAYIKLGDIFRAQGHALRASKIHRNLLLRTTLTEEQTRETLYHLVLDYRAADMIDKAVETAERLVQREKKNLDVRRLMLELYEDKGEWDKAFFMRQGINRWVKKADQNVLALYKVHSGRDLTARGQEHQGRIRFREAIKLDRGCVAASLALGDSYRREGRHEDALKVWRDLAARNPAQAHLVLDRLNEVLYDLGRYSEMEAVCEEVLRARPAHPGAAFRLIDIYEKQGKPQQALDLCRQWYEKNPENPKVRETLVRLLSQYGRRDEALSTAMAILGRESAKDMEYRCTRCGRAAREAFWRCPECRQWLPAVPEQEP